MLFKKTTLKKALSDIATHYEYSNKTKEQKKNDYDMFSQFIDTCGNYEPKTFTTADVCEEAHNLTVKLCEQLELPLNCEGIMDCTDGGITHDTEDEEYEEHYSANAQLIFSVCQKYIENFYEQAGYINENDL